MRNCFYIGGKKYMIPGQEQLLTGIGMGFSLVILSWLFSIPLKFFFNLIKKG